MTPSFCPFVATWFSPLLNPQPPVRVSPGLSACARVAGPASATTVAASALNAAFFAVFTAPPNPRRDARDGVRDPESRTHPELPATAAIAYAPLGKFLLSGREKDAGAAAEATAPTPGMVLFQAAGGGSYGGQSYTLPMR